VIVDHTRTGDYRAVSKSDDRTMEIADVKERIGVTHRTDIMTDTAGN
jgi:hypothetical protein